MCPRIRVWLLTVLGGAGLALSVCAAGEPVAQLSPEVAGESVADGVGVDNAGAGSGADDVERDTAGRVFTLKVLPLLRARCLVCHGGLPDDIKGGFDMRSRETVLRGGESEEPAVVPGHPERSPLLAAVLWEGLRMPPKENDRLSDAEANLLSAWIADGAVWPNEETQRRYLAEERARPVTADGVLVRTSGGLSDEWTWRRYQPANLWAYQPLRSFDLPDPPAATSAGAALAVENPIDVLIGKRLAADGIEPAPLADRRTLIRRATFDLTGLPPTPEEIAAFMDDPAGDEDAFARVVDRLLASPHYGEQWGRHWLDVVRYADSSGYANDYERGNAWRYRDYVVRAFNDDRPYDRFIREQIAGDEIDPADPELLIAVGFLRMGPWELTGMEVARIARQRFLDDVTDAVGQVFLGHMLQCARCHDHKFDPVPTRDYYSIQATFATTQLAERTATFLPQENTTGFDEKKYLNQRQSFYQRIERELEEKRTIEAARAWFVDNNRDSTTFEATVKELTDDPKRGVDDVTVDLVRRKMAQQNVHPDLIPPRHVGFSPQEFGMERVVRKGQERLRWRFERYEPFALSVYSGRTPLLKNVSAPLRVPGDRMTSGELENTCVLVGGDPFSPSLPVTPGLLSAVEQVTGSMDSAEVSEPGRASDPETGKAADHSGISGRRKHLAEWIASPDNPLTARVMVNRIWQWHFGQAIAGNPSNFGTTGRKPTHPELLDWLGSRFVADGWSMKAMHRRIMLSKAWRRSARHPSADVLRERDPDGSSYAVFRTRRLDAEELRDSMLSVSGELNPVIGGIPVRPEMNLEAALQPRMVMGTFAEAWQPSPLPEQRHRRSLYALRLRGQRDPFQEVFNSPSPDLSCEAREASTVTPQVFAMFNSEITFDRSLAFAIRLLALTETASGNGFDPDVIRNAFRLVSGRLPDDHELMACLEHWKSMTQRHQSLRFEPPDYPHEVVREAVEENTGEKFTFVEPLEVYADFVPDRKSADVDARTRGLAEVCLVLLNSNEFAYVE